MPLDGNVIIKADGGSAITSSANSSSIKIKGIQRGKANYVRIRYNSGASGTATSTAQFKVQHSADDSTYYDHVVDADQTVTLPTSGAVEGILYLPVSTDKPYIRIALVIAPGATVALAPGRGPGIHHINHQVESNDDVLRSYYHLSGQRMPIVFGPGRHPTSGARFLYFPGPGEMMFEYSVGVDEIEDEENHRPRQFGFEPSSLCMWGQSLSDHAERTHGSTPSVIPAAPHP